MWKKISALLRPKINNQKQQNEALEELRIATASLLYRAGNIDGTISEIELGRLTKLLKTHIDLSET